MHNIIDWVADICALLAVVGAVVYLRDIKPVFKTLREHHPAQWQALDMQDIPEQLEMDKIVHPAFSKPMLLWLLLRTYGSLNDADLASRCEKLRQKALVMLGCTAVVIVVMVPEAVISILHHPALFH